MKRHLARKTLVTLGLVCLSALLLPAAAFPWNQATHAYIADALAACAGHDNLQEMWGSTAPDFFNYLFDPALCPGWLSDQTHGMETDTFLKVWNAAGSEKDKALAYGFVSHNNAWGADHVAHEALPVRFLRRSQDGGGGRVIPPEADIRVFRGIGGDEQVGKPLAFTARRRRQLAAEVRVDFANLQEHGIVYDYRGKPGP